MFGFARKTVNYDGFLVTPAQANAADYVKAYCAQTTAVQRHLIAAELASGTSVEQVAKSIRKVSGFAL